MSLIDFLYYLYNSSNINKPIQTKLDIGTRFASHNMTRNCSITLGRYVGIYFLNFKTISHLKTILSDTNIGLPKNSLCFAQNKCINN